MALNLTTKRLSLLNPVLVGSFLTSVGVLVALSREQQESPANPRT